MNIFELVLLAVSLSMDSFASAVCKGIEAKYSLKKAIIICLWFSIFQTTMPIIGFNLFSIFGDFFASVDHFIAFIILLYLGISMFNSAKEKKKVNSSLLFKEMFLLSIAISLDAFSVGITFEMLNVNILLSSLITFIITFITTYIGFLIGSISGDKMNSYSLKFGGLVLISLGFKILLTHLSIL